jgi:hypothetical protein
MALHLHAIVLALNEELFIENCLKTLYPFCQGISVLTQYDRDWYGKKVSPDQTADKVLDYPDPQGKIHLVMRRYPDEAAARNSEMKALVARPDRGIMSHGSPMDRIRSFHAEPDYFWIVDADEIYDTTTLPAILDRLERRRPRGMRVHGLNHLRTWNRQVPFEVVPFAHFGFLRPGINFECRRTVSWNESRLAKAFRMLRLPDFSARAFGFETCPREVGFFYHGCWLGGRQRLAAKVAKSSHGDTNNSEYRSMVEAYPTRFVPRESLPLNIREGAWMPGLIE